MLLAHIARSYRIVLHNKQGPLEVPLVLVFLDLRFAYSEDFSSAAWTFTLSRWATIFHRYCLGILNIHLFPALHTIGLH